MGNSEAHLALILFGLLLRQLAEGVTTAQLPSRPTGLTALISEQARLANLLWGD
jgi:hypothetical protein